MVGHIPVRTHFVTGNALYIGYVPGYSFLQSEPTSTPDAPTNKLKNENESRGIKVSLMARQKQVLQNKLSAGDPRELDSNKTVTPDGLELE